MKKMKFTKTQIVFILILNLFMLSISFFGVIKWIGISNTKTIASLMSSLIFLAFVLMVLKQHYALLFKQK